MLIILVSKSPQVKYKYIHQAAVINYPKSYVNTIQNLKEIHLKIWPMELYLIIKKNNKVQEVTNWSLTELTIYTACFSAIRFASCFSVRLYCTCIWSEYNNKKKENPASFHHCSSDGTCEINCLLSYWLSLPKNALKSLDSWHIVTWVTSWCNSVLQCACVYISCLYWKQYIIQYSDIQSCEKRKYTVFEFYGFTYRILWFSYYTLSLFCKN